MTMSFEFVREERHGASWMPTVDVCERASEICIFVEMPGVERKDIHVTWHEGVLTIAGSKQRHSSEKGAARYLCVERTYGHFRREIEINIPVDHAGAKAHLRDGLLKIQLPKATSKPEPVVIPVL
jgi:HSP20 family protein